MYKIFDTLADYNQYTDNGTHLTAGILYIVKENKSLYFQTNNIDGEAEKYEYLDEIPEGYIKPEGNIIITENDEEIDIAQYATASVNVAPNLTTQNITENGTYQPSGDYDGFSSVTVNVAGSGDEDLINLIERDITSLNIPSGTTKIGEYAFYNSSLTSVTIPEGVTSIGNWAFFDCNSLTSINIPSGVTSIGEFAFYHCSGITRVTIGSGVTSIEGSAFYECTGLTSVTIPNNVRTIKNDVFNGCSNLASVVIENGVTSIEGSAFQNCLKLTNVTIPDSVTKIGGQIFRHCVSLTNAVIGNGITSIGGSAFYECTSLTSVTIQATTPPTLGNTADFAGSYPIYVPAESVEAYKTATNWSAYADRIQAIS